LDKRKAHK